MLRRVNPQQPKCWISVAELEYRRECWQMYTLTLKSLPSIYLLTSYRLPNIERGKVALKSIIQCVVVKWKEWNQDFDTSI